VRHVRFRTGIQFKLFLPTFLAVAAALLIAGLVLRHRTAADVTRQIRSDLVQRALVVAECVRVGAVRPTDFAALDGAADHLGNLSKTRVSLIRQDGVVVGDSDVPLNLLQHVENHLGRPEVQQAIATGVGSDVRRSETVRLNMMYVTVPWRNATDTLGVVRLALPLKEVEATSNALAFQLGFGALVAVVVALLVSALAANLGTRAARSLTRVASRMSRGDLEARSDLVGEDEWAILGRALNGLAANLSSTLGELRAEKSRLDDVLSSMQEGVLLVDAGGRLQLANRAVTEMLNLRTKVIGEKLENLLDPRGALLALLERARAGHDGTNEIQLARPQSRVLLANVRRVTGGSGGVLCVLVDLTDERRLQNVRRDFVANASHELRTPIAAISSAVETLVDAAANDPEAAAHFTRMIARNAERLRNLVDDLLALSRLESGTMHAELQSTRLSTIADAIVASFAEAAERKGTELRSLVPAGLEATADGRGLEHVLGNLVDNAIKYSPDRAHVTITAQETSLGVELSVSDDGPGIPVEHRERIFERFYRVDAGRSRDLGGTGLGLAIVRHWVDAMGGTVQVKSSSSKGTEFCVSLQQEAPTSRTSEAEG
jgi:two-component system phosphate regulon sensor histidine kinase PhoR